MARAPSAPTTLLRFAETFGELLGPLGDGGTTGPSPAALRVLDALSRRGEGTARDLAGDLDLDPGHLSRLLGALHRRRLVRRRRSREDRRAAVLSLSAKGRRALRERGKRARAAAAALLKPLPPRDRERLRRALEAAGALLEGRPPSTAPVVLRSPAPGDLGWLVHRHGVLSAREGGRGGRLEGVAARAAADFLRSRDPRRERAWVADRDGEAVGGVLLVRKSAATARLRLLLVEPAARGRGLGRLLVEECLRFAAAAGYRKVVLWTDTTLKEARALYGKAGFRPVRRKRHPDFGGRRTAAMWERAVG